MANCGYLWPMSKFSLDTALELRGSLLNLGFAEVRRDASITAGSR